MVHFSLYLSSLIWELSQSYDFKSEDFYSSVERVIIHFEHQIIAIDNKLQIELVITVEILSVAQHFTILIKAFYTLYLVDLIANAAAISLSHSNLLHPSDCYSMHLLLVSFLELVQELLQLLSDHVLKSLFLLLFI